MLHPDDERKALSPLFDAILKYIPGPAYDPEKPFQMLVADLDYSDYLGRLAVGRILNGEARTKDALACIGADGAVRPLKATRIQIYKASPCWTWMRLSPETSSSWPALKTSPSATPSAPETTRKPSPAFTWTNPPLPCVSASTPPLWAGREGKIVQARKIRERLEREALRNVSIRVEDTEDRDAFLVKGRGEFQMAILVETMRREGFELTVGRPEVIVKTIDGGKNGTD